LALTGGLGRSLPVPRRAWDTWDILPGSDAFMQVESHVDLDLDPGQPPPKPLGLEDCELLFVFNKSLK